MAYRLRKETAQLRIKLEEPNGQADNLNQRCLRRHRWYHGAYHAATPRCGPGRQRHHGPLCWTEKHQGWQIKGDLTTHTHWSREHWWNMGSLVIFNFMMPICWLFRHLNKVILRATSIANWLRFPQARNTAFCVKCVSPRGEQQPSRHNSVYQGS